jgi:hypothetical protein
MNKITVLFPGGFKPLTGAHLALARRYAEQPDVDQVILLIGPTDREHITREKSIAIFNILNYDSKITIQPTRFNSPILAAYEYLFDLPEDATGNYAMAASTKGDDYVRAKSFVGNVDKYRTVGDKSGRMIAPNINATELNIDVEPLTYENGMPISATAVRQSIMHNDFDTFKSSYPEHTEADVKRIWTLLTGLTETTKISIDADIHEEVIKFLEGYIDAKTSKKHQRKISKLKQFLDANPSKPFTYDFNDFEKTILGVRINESNLNENYITRDELREIEPTIDRFFKRHGIDVDFQGYSTHFIDRLNDPRNEGTIRLDDLENLFRDLSDEYGEDIIRQYQQGNLSAVDSDYQFDVPLHMPFQLEFDRQKGQIKLIPRTIKAQRSPWQSNNPNDVIYTIESANSAETDITEGGAAGHMQHPYENFNLTFGDMKEIVSRTLSGQLDIEDAVTEKTDGQNIQVTWKNGQAGFARNKSSIINPMTPEQLISDFTRKYNETRDKHGEKLAAAYKPVVDAYQACAEDLSNAMNKLGQATLDKIFKNGRVFANMEIIFPATRNVISYDKAHLQFHNLVEYDDRGNKIETDLSGGTMLQKIIQDANAHLQKTFSFIPPHQIKIGKFADFDDQQSVFFNEINQLRNKYNLTDNDMILDYHEKWWQDVIQTKATQLQYDIPENILKLLVNRWAFAEKTVNVTAIKKQITSAEFATWVNEFDKQDFKTYQKDNIEPFESIFLRLGVVAMRNVENFLAANPTTAVQQIKQEIAELVKDLQTRGDEKTIKKLEHELRRIQKLGGFDSIVPSEGVVFVYGGRTYKLTGAFASVNQILGTLKYAR